MDSRRVAYLFTLCPFVPLPRGTFQHRSHKLLGSSENKKAPRSRGRNEGHALAARQAPHDFSGALLVQTDTDERGAIVHGPVAPILPDDHTIAPLGKWGRARRLCPVGGYLLLHQRPSASLAGQYQPLPLVLGFIGPCVGHRGVVSSADLGATGNRCSTASRRCSNRPSSLSRSVSCTWRPASSTWTLTLAGASGSGVLGTAGEACVRVGWLAAPASSFALVSSCARLAIAALRRCLQKLWGAFS